MAENLLGKATPLVDHYSPDLLYPIERAVGRQALELDEHSRWRGGEDVWHAWELSWLGEDGLPRVAVARITVPAHSPAIVESKSLKLYLNSLYQTAYADAEAVKQVLEADLSQVAGASVAVEVLDIDSEALRPTHMPGRCLDMLVPKKTAPVPDRELICCGTEHRDEILHSHLLRSLCPVTAQPDWATVLVSYCGPALEPESLLGYILSFRNHQEFHEQCVERIYCDIQLACAPEELSVQALYTRRGGLDINPFRSSVSSAAPILRSQRQ